MSENNQKQENQMMLVMNQAAIQKLDQLIAEMPYKYADQIYKVIIPYITAVQNSEEENQHLKSKTDIKINPKKS
jgi:hypothetical protein